MAAPKWVYMAILALLSLAICTAHRVPPTTEAEKVDKPELRVLLGGTSGGHMDDGFGKWGRDHPSGGGVHTGGTPAVSSGGGYGRGSGSTNGGGGGGGGGWSSSGGNPNYGGAPGGNGGGYGWGGGSGGGGDNPGAGGYPIPGMPGAGGYPIPGIPGAGGYPIPGMPGAGGYPIPGMPGAGGYPIPGIGYPPFNEPLHCTPQSCYEKYGSACNGVHVRFDYVHYKPITGNFGDTHPMKKGSGPDHEMMAKSSAEHKLNGLNNGVPSENTALHRQSEQVMDAMAPESS